MRAAATTTTAATEAGVATAATAAATSTAGVGAATEASSSTTEAGEASASHQRILKCKKEINKLPPRSTNKFIELKKMWTSTAST